MFLDLLYPRRCPVCADVVMPRGGLVCAECEEKVPYIQSPTCYRCGKELTNERHEFCYDCYEADVNKKKIYYNRGVAALKYTASMKRPMEGLKYSNKREYADFFAEAILEKCRNTIEEWQADIMIPVPIHPSRRIKRGYNQAELLARRINKKLSLGLEEKVLVRSKKTTVQNRLDDKDRKKNMVGAFKISKNVVQSKKVILIDDIYTTGSTVNECAKVLKQAGATEVYFVCACIGTGF